MWVYRLRNDTDREYHVGGEITGETHAVFLANVQMTRAEEEIPLAYSRGRMDEFVFSPGNSNVLLWWDALQWEEDSYERI